MGTEDKTKSRNKSLDKIKTSVLSRGLSLAKVTLKAGASVAQHGLSSAFKDSQEKESSWKQLIQTQAASLTNELGELKGSLMKAGQLISMYGEHFLPPEANQFLRNLQSNSPPLDWKVIEPILKNQLQEKMQLLEIDPIPLASASMGQVHKARIKSSNEWIALKVQYPNVDRAIDSDLKALRTLLGTLKLLPKDMNLDPLFEEVRLMLHQEVDYVQEAQLTEDFASLLMEDLRFIIPKVYREFSTDKILATSFEAGHRVDSSEVQSLSEDQRNHLALNFLDLYFLEVFRWGFVQTDPHAGNYQIRINPNEEPQLILFDFGASRRYTNEFIIPYRRMIKASLESDEEAFLLAAADLGFIKSEDPPDLQKLFVDFCSETVEPFLAPDDIRNVNSRIQPDGRYDWKNTDLPERLSKKVFEIIRKFSWRSPPKEIVFLDRKTGGVFIFLSLLRAKVNGRSLLLKHLKDVDLNDA